MVFKCILCISALSIIRSDITFSSSFRTISPTFILRNAIVKNYSWAPHIHTKAPPDLDTSHPDVPASRKTRVSCVPSARGCVDNVAFSLISVGLQIDVAHDMMMVNSNNFGKQAKSLEEMIYFPALILTDIASSYGFHFSFSCAWLGTMSFNVKDFGRD